MQALSDALTTPDDAARLSAIQCVTRLAEVARPPRPAPPARPPTSPASSPGLLTSANLRWVGGRAAGRRVGGQADRRFRTERRVQVARASSKSAASIQYSAMALMLYRQG